MVKKIKINHHTWYRATKATHTREVQIARTPHRSEPSEPFMTFVLQDYRQIEIKSIDSHLLILKSTKDLLKKEQSKNCFGFNCCGHMVPKLKRKEREEKRKWRSAIPGMNVVRNIHSGRESSPWPLQQCKYERYNQTTVVGNIIIIIMMNLMIFLDIMN